MLQPLAITIVFGLSFSSLVSLFLVPAVYRMFAVGSRARPAPLEQAGSAA
jgi:Cu/Ag efflux pump CusA